MVTQDLSLASLPRSDSAEAAGLRFGDKGTHTSRTIMLAELRDTLAAVPIPATREDYIRAIVDDNFLGKSTASTRRLTSQRLGELYGLDRRIPVFRVLRRLWELDAPGRPRLALLCSLARDPLLRTTAAAIVNLTDGEELVRSVFIEQIRTGTGERLNDSILDKVARNAASSWTQSGHLEGRVRKRRKRVEPTPGAVAFAFWLGSLQGLSGEQLLSTFWTRVFDGGRSALLDAAQRARQLGLIHLRVGGQVTEIDATNVDAVGEVG